MTGIAFKSNFNIPNYLFTKPKRAVNSLPQSITRRSMQQSPFSFDQFKRTAFQQKAPKAYSEVLFQIHFDEFGASLLVTDGKGNPVSASYLNYGGAVRTAAI